MPAFSQNQIEEINAIIKTIESEIKPKMEIGERQSCFSWSFAIQ